MLREAEGPGGNSPAAVPAPSAAWLAPLAALALAWAALALLFRSDWEAMAGQWWNSSSYNHILLIPLIVAWLVRQRVQELARLAPRGWWPGLILFAGALLLWLLGAFSGLSSARQLGAVAMLLAAVPTIFGPKVAWGLAFPLGYMFLLVPIGDELVPPLQMVTAALAAGLVRLSQIPAAIDGVFITTPAGLFEVAEACSGVKFLTAMFAFGVLAAHLCFRSWRRRAAFLVVCLVAPILANGVRAWGTIMAAQFVGAEAASGLDHIVYGWVFFALVVAMVIAASWRFFDRAPDDPAIDAARIDASPRLARLERRTLPILPLLVAMALLTLGTQGWARAADALRAPLPPQIFLPQVPGWHRVDYRPRVWWMPQAGGAEHRLLGRYADGKRHEVDVFLALYSVQREGLEAGGFGQGALPEEQGWSWLAPGPAAGPARVDRLLSDKGTARLAETYYRSGDLLTGSNARLKLALVADRLLLRPRPTMLLILSSEEDGRDSAGESLAAFRRSAGPLDGWMDRVAALR
jgi:exosortase A